MRSNTKDLIYMAMYLALFYVFDLIANQLQLFKMPQGGTLGLGVVALILASYHLGYKKGIVVGLLSIVLQFMTGHMYIVSPMQFVLEYVLAFGLYGLWSLFPNVYLIYTGIIITNLLRLLFHTLAGIFYWETGLIPSLAYNAWYMIPTMLLCLVLVPLIEKRIKKL